MKWLLIINYIVNCVDVIVTLQTWQWHKLNNQVHDFLYNLPTDNTLHFSFLSSPKPKAGIRCLSVKIFKWHLLWSHEADPYQISPIASIGRGTNDMVFCSSQIRTLVAMATDCCLWLIMGKVEISIYCCLTADILTKVLQKYSLSSHLPNIWFLSKPLNLIGYHGNQNFKFAKKYSKIISSEAIRGMKLKLHRKVHNISLYKNYVFYYCCSCTLVAMAT